MDRNFFDKQMRRASYRFWFVAGLLSLSIASNFAQIVAQPSSTTILIPARISGTYEITRNHFDRLWLADASGDAAMTMFNVTPETGNWRREQMLKWVHPRGRQALISQLDDELVTIRKKKLSMALSVKKVDVPSNKPESDQITTSVEAVLTRWIAGREVERMAITVALDWERDARGAPLIRRLKWKESENE